MRRISVLLFLCCTLAANSQDAGPPDPFPEPQQSWDIGIAEFLGKNVAQDQAYLKRSLPLALLEVLRSVETHEIGPEEREAMQEDLLRRAIDDSKRSLWSLRENRSTSFLEGKEISELTEQIAEMEANLESLMQFDSSTVEIPSSLPVKFVGADGEELLPSVTEGLQAAADKAPVDFLISGAIFENEGALKVTVQTLRRIDGSVSTVEIAGTAETVLADLKSYSGDIRRQALGREWADVFVSTDYPDAQVYLNGDLVGIGNAVSQNLVPETHTLTVRLAGYEEYKSEIELEPGLQHEIQIALAPLGTNTVFIGSSPSSSRVYLGAEFLGITPLYFEHTGVPGRLTFRRDGYHQSSFILTDDSNVDVGLVPLQIDVDQIITKSRNRFYTSLGAFVVTLPIPFLAWYGSVEQVIAVGQSTGLEQQRHFVMQNILYYSYVGGIFVSGGLLVDSVVHLFRYFEIQESLGR